MKLNECNDKWNWNNEKINEIEWNKWNEIEIVKR